MNKQNKGFTLVEIAIVLVIIGLLLGGILKGQELINNARVRAISDRSSSLKAAWYAFIDRYQALPGDFVQARQYVPNTVANGNGDGKLTLLDSPLVFNHLTGAGLLRCTVCTSSGSVESLADNSLVNLYGGVMSIWSNSNSYLTLNGPNNIPKLMAHTGPRIPSNIITEVDRKIDDGLPHRGDFRYVDYDPTQGSTANTALVIGECVSTANGTATAASAGDLSAETDWLWRDVRQTPPTTANCGGGSFF